MKQRADLTFRHNRMNGRHGWLRLTPAYSVKVVEDLLEDRDPGLRVLDPFSGTATTPLCAAMRGHEAVSIDVNPFLVWFGNAKLAEYGPDTLATVWQAGSRIAREADGEGQPLSDTPALHNIDRWWSPERLLYLRKVRAAIAHAAPPDTPVRNLLDVAFCRTMMALSNAAFNHQSMSFKDVSADVTQGILFATDGRREQFENDVRFVVRTSEANPRALAGVQLGDARRLDPAGCGRFQLLITSPPYPNRMSYIRELRPYMYWLGFLREAREAGNLDCRAIGGTWGAATSALAAWSPDRTAFVPSYLKEAIEAIGSADNKSGRLLAHYVAKYFEDMWRHIERLHLVMDDGASVHYIVGNSKFYQVLVPVERVFCDMLSAAGIHGVGCRTLRKRNSKKELFEFEVFGRR